MKRFLETLTAWEGAVRGDAALKKVKDAVQASAAGEEAEDGKSA